MAVKPLKNRSYFTNETGFILPSVVFLIFVLFVIFLANVSVYELELTMGEHHLEQVKIETLIQLGLESYKDDLQKSETFIPKKNYSFPYGEVFISAYEDKPRQIITINININTDQNQQYRTDFSIPLLNN